MRRFPFVRAVGTFLLAGLFVLSFVGCGAIGDLLFPRYAFSEEDRLIGEGDPTVLVIGNSVMEFNIWDHAAIAYVIAKGTGRTVRNNGESGARLSAPESDIRSQYRPGS